MCKGLNQLQHTCIVLISLIYIIIYSQWLSYSLSVAWHGLTIRCSFNRLDQAVVLIGGPWVVLYRSRGSYLRVCPFSFSIFWFLMGLNAVVLFCGGGVRSSVLLTGLGCGTFRRPLSSPTSVYGYSSTGLPIQFLILGVSVGFHVALEERISSAMLCWRLGELCSPCWCLYTPISIKYF